MSFAQRKIEGAVMQIATIFNRKSSSVFDKIAARNALVMICDAMMACDVGLTEVSAHIINTVDTEADDIIRELSS